MSLFDDKVVPPIPRCAGCGVVLSPQEIELEDVLCGICREYGVAPHTEDQVGQPWPEAVEVKSDTYD